MSFTDYQDNKRDIDWLIYKNTQKETGGNLLSLRCIFIFN